MHCGNEINACRSNHSSSSFCRFRFGLRYFIDCTYSLCDHYKIALKKFIKNGVDEIEVFFTVDAVRHRFRFAFHFERQRRRAHVWALASISLFSHLILFCLFFFLSLLLLHCRCISMHFGVVCASKTQWYIFHWLFLLAAHTINKRSTHKRRGCQSRSLLLISVHKRFVWRIQSTNETRQKKPKKIIRIEADRRRRRNPLIVFEPE